MLAKIREMWDVTASARKESVSIRRRLGLYWGSLVLAAFGALLLVLSFAGVFSNPAQHLGELLENQHRNTAAALSEQVNQLTAQGISLSESISRELREALIGQGLRIEDLNDNRPLIEAVEKAVYGPVHTALCASDCNGVFVLLNATANTKLPNAEQSRLGIYLRYSDLNATGNANQRLAYFRGVPQVSREKQVRMHNRWNPEFDITQVPGFGSLMDARVTRLAEHCLWSPRINLKDTWENAVLVYLPVLDSGGTVAGVCGMEVGELYFYLSYPTAESQYGRMVTVMAPLDGDTLRMDQAMIGNAAGTQLEPEGSLSIEKENFFNVYSSGETRYLGLHQVLEGVTADGMSLAAVTLIPESGYLSFASAARSRWIVGSLAFLCCMLLLARLLSGQFAKPIEEGLRAIRTETDGDHRSGISEIDELMTFLQSQSAKKDLGGLPPNIEELLQSFRGKVQLLTPTERRILQYYIDGYSLKEIPALAYISISTAKTHNTNINRKLDISSRDELMLYIDLFRRCDRLKEITYG